MNRRTSVWRASFSSLRERNYRLYFFPQLASDAGSWMNMVATGWLVLELTGRGADVGLMVAAGTLPMLLGGAWAGLIADRFDKRRLLLASDAALGVLSAIVAVLVITDSMQLWMLFVLTILQGCAGTLAVPTQDAFVVEIVGPEHMTNAVGLKSVVAGSARIIGAGAAGLLIALVGTWACFLVDAASYLVSSAGLVAMKVSELHRSERVAPARRQVRAGIRYVWADPDLRPVVLLVAMVGTLAFNFPVLLPLLARNTFHAGGGAYGLMTSVMAAASLVGAFVIAGRSAPTPRRLAGSGAAMGGALLATAMAPTLVVALVALAVVSICAVTFLTAAATIIQLNSRPEMRGRVMGIYGIVFLGTTSVGAPVMGWVAERFGAGVGLAVGGVAGIAGGALFARRAAPVVVGDLDGAPIEPGPA